MTFVNCCACGRRMLKSDAIVSRSTGRVWCSDQAACDRRVYEVAGQYEPTDREIYATVGEQDGRDEHDWTL